MKIAHAITCLLRGGAEENTIATCNAQSTRGHDVYLIHGQEVDAAMRGTVSPKVKIIQIDSLLRSIHLQKDIAALKEFVRIFRMIEPDVVHTHNSKAGFIGRLAANNAKIPVIVHGVHILPFVNVPKVQGYVYLAMEKWVAPYTDAFIAVSSGMREANLAAGLGRDDTNHVVYSGMHLQRFRAVNPAASPYDRGGRLIVIVASLEERKRHGEFLEVFAALCTRHPDLNLALLGQGPLKEELERKAEALGVREATHFLGFRSDVEQWLAAAAICVLPSLREGLPRSVVQYVAAGRPVVVTHLPGIEEIVVDGENGFVVESGKVADMEAPLERLLSEPCVAARMAETASDWDVSRWSMDRMEPQIEEIISAISIRKGVVRAAATGRPASA